MSLRKSTIIIITLTLIGLLAILYGTSRHIILTNFIDLEKQVVEQNLERGQNALDNEIAKIDSFAHDWGAWDDTYEFVVDKNEEYIRSNLGDETFIDMPLNFLLFYDTSGALVWGGAFDLEEEKTMEVPGELMERLSLDSPFLRHPDVESMVNGILLLPDGPLLVASRPILTSKNEGPIRGTLIMARFLAPKTIQELAEQTKLRLRFFRTDSPDLPREAADAILDLNGPGQFSVRPAENDTVNGFSLIRDVYNRPALVLKMDMPRDIYNQGVAALRHNLISLLAVGVIFGLVILFRALCHLEPPSNSRIRVLLFR